MKKQTSRKPVLSYFLSVIFFTMGFLLLGQIHSGMLNAVYAANVDIIVPPIATAIQLPTKIDAKDYFIPKAEALWEAKTDQRKGLRVHQYGELLPAGTIVKPDSINGNLVDEMVCVNESWLFFIDEAPGAHFAHPVRIVIVDKETNIQKTIEASMWPVVEPPGDVKKTLFGTFSTRNNHETIILEKQSILGPSSQLLPDLQVLPPISVPLEIDDCCDTWAILVCGYNDLPDTFDDDTNGMYNVLKGLGVSDDHIYYLSPHTSHAGVDRATTYPDVQWAISEVAAQSGTEDKVLFLYSSHGNVNVLSCVPDISPPGQRSISASALDGWLDAIISAEMTIIIEACHSGSLIGLYEDGTYVLAEDELTGDGETNRAVFTSASTDTSSYPDKDYTDAPADPNPGDVGSESIGGFMEAFSVPAADTNLDNAISFNEAFTYAWDNDITRIRGMNMPQMVHTGLNTDDLFLHCYPTCDANGSYVIDCESGLTEILLNGSGSTDPAPCEAFLYSWETDCPGAWFDNQYSATPWLNNLTPEGGALECSASLTVSCLDGNWEDCSSPVRINDPYPPSITCPVDTAIECHESKLPGNTGNAVVSDSCDPAPAVTYSDVISPGDCPDANTITRNWEVTDGSGNSDSCVQMIDVTDETSPVLSGVPEDILVECDSVPEPAVVTASDNCDSNLGLNYSATRTDGSCPSNYTLTRTWSATDQCGNNTTETQVVTVEDTTSPVISCNTPSVITPPDAPIIFTATATDNCDSDLFVEITGYDCFFFTKKGKKINKTESCVVKIVNNQLTILDSGGVGDQITWTVESNDNCGNSTVSECEVEVVNPAK